MIEFRKRNGLTLDSMARICDCSKVLIDMLESSEKEVTHPDIAERVRKAYKLTPEFSSSKVVRSSLKFRTFLPIFFRVSAL